MRPHSLKYNSLLIYGIKKFRHYIHYSCFTVVTDDKLPCFKKTVLTIAAARIQRCSTAMHIITSGVLTILNKELNDAGNYHCIVPNVYRSVSDSIDLIVEDNSTL